MQFEFLKAKDVSPTVQREIRAFLDYQNTSHPFQYPDWMNHDDDFAYREMYLAIGRAHSKICWFALCGVSRPAGTWLKIVRSLIVYRGPACDDPELVLQGLRQLAEKSKQLGFIFVEVAPDWVDHAGLKLASTLTREGWQSLPDRRTSLRLSLTPNDDALLRGFRKATRYEIRRSADHGVVVRFAQNERDIEEFQRIHFEMAQRKKFPAPDPKDFAHILRRIVRETDRGALLLAFKDEALLGGTLVVRAAVRSWYVFGATTKDDRLSAGHLLQWHAIRWAKDHGCLEYDFGGFQEGVNTGPALFKRGFCQTVVRFSPAYRYCLNRPICRLLNFATKLRTKPGVCQ